MEEQETRERRAHYFTKAKGYTIHEAGARDFKEVGLDDGYCGLDSSSKVR